MLAPARRLPPCLRPDVRRVLMPLELPPDPATDADAQSLLSRRHLLQMLGAAGGAVAGAPVLAPLLGGGNLPVTGEAAAMTQATPSAAAAAAGSALPPNIPPWMLQWGPLASPYGERSPYEQNVVRIPIPTEPVDSCAPLQDFYGTITPNALFYEIHFGGIPDRPGEHRLLVHGLVERPTLFTMDDLKRFPAVSVIHFLECSGNSFTQWTEASMRPTVQLSHGWPVAPNGPGCRWPPSCARSGSNRAAGGCWPKGPMPPARPQHPDGQGDGRRAARLRRKRRGPAPLPGLSAAPAAARLRRQHQRQVAAPPQGRRTSPGRRGRRPPTTPISCPMGRRASSPSSWKPSRSSRPPPAGRRSPDPGFVEITGLAWSGRGRDRPGRCLHRRRRRAGRRRRCRSRCCRCLDPLPPPLDVGRPAGPPAEPGHRRDRLRAADASPQLVEARGVNSFYHFNGIKTWAIAANGEVTNVYA